MRLIKAIKDIIFKVKDYDRLEMDYSEVLGIATGGELSYTNYEMNAVYKCISDYQNRRDREMFSNLWHDHTENPEDCSEVLLYFPGVKNRTVVMNYTDCRHCNNYIAGSKKWAYIDDLLPLEYQIV